MVEILTFSRGMIFAKTKYSFVDPRRSLKFMSVTWGGMMGVSSGMHAAWPKRSYHQCGNLKSQWWQNTIGILTRKNLQYAATLEEAINIC